MEEVYENFDVRVISTGIGRKYKLLVRYEGVQPEEGRVVQCELPPSYADLLVEPAASERRRWRKGPLADEEGFIRYATDLDVVKEVGGRLFDALLQGELAGEFGMVANRSAPNGGLRLRINLTDAPELAREPWETLYRKRNEMLLAIDASTNVVRMLDSPTPGQAEPILPPVRLLVVTAVPKRDLDADREVTNIQLRASRLIEGKRAVPFKIDVLEKANRASLQERLRDHEPHIIHYIGHGSFSQGTGWIHLHDEADPEEVDRIDAETLRDMFANDRPRVVVLNTCQGGLGSALNSFDGVAQALIQRNIPYVVAMQHSISDDAAIAFSDSLYADLAAGRPIDVAVSRARNAIRLLKDPLNQVELITPVLYTSGSLKRLIEAPPPPPLAPSPPANSGAGKRRIGLWLLAGGLLLFVLLILFAALTLRGVGSADPSSAGEDMNVGAALDGAARGDVIAGAGDVGTALDGGAGGDEMDGASQPTVAPDGSRDFATRTRPRAAPPPRAPSRGSEREAESGGIDLTIEEEAVPPPPFAPAPPPPPSPPPAPVLPPPAPVLEESFTIFFESGASTITPQAAAILDGIASASRTGGQVALSVSAGTDRLGGANENRVLSQERADAIQAYLVSRGVPETSISTEALGESRPLVETADGVREAMNNYAQISLSSYAPDRLGAIGEPAGIQVPVPPTVPASFAKDDPGAAHDRIRDIAAFLLQPDHAALAVEVTGRGGSDYEQRLAWATELAGMLEAAGVPSGRIKANAIGETMVAEEDSSALSAELVLWLGGAEEVRFAFGSESVPQDERSKLEMLAAWLADHRSLDLLLRGHTDRAGPASFNLGLSSRRADSVARSLRDAGVDGERISLESFGERSPAPGPARRASDDRRVELLIVPAEP